MNEDVKLRQVNEKILEREDVVKNLKNKQSEIPHAYQIHQTIVKREKEIWERLAFLSKGTEMEKEAVDKLYSIEEEQELYQRTFEEADYTIQEKISLEKKQLQRLEEDLSLMKEKDKNA